VPNPLPHGAKNLIRNGSTMGLRQLLHNSNATRSFRCYAYAELLRRKHNSRNKRHGR
jgi:hypothetical protein